MADADLPAPLLRSRRRWRRLALLVGGALLLLAAFIFGVRIFFERSLNRELQNVLAEADRLAPNWHLDELEARIDVLLRRTHPDRDRVIRFGPVSVLAEEFGAYVDGRPIELSPREFEVLRLLIARAPRLVPKRSLVDALAQSNLEINDSAAELYVSRLRKRLEGSGVEIRTMRGVGYQLALTPAAQPGTPE